MSDDLQQPPPRRAGPFIGGIIAGIFGTLLFEVFTAVFTIPQSRSPSGIKSLLLNLGILAIGLGLVIRVVLNARAASGARKFYNMGVLAGVCLNLLLVGICFAVATNSIGT